MNDTVKIHTIPVVERTFEHSAAFMERWGSTISATGMTLPIPNKDLDPQTPLELALSLQNGRPILEGRVLVKQCHAHGIDVKFVKMTERSTVNIEMAAEYNA